MTENLTFENESNEIDLTFSGYIGQIQSATFDEETETQTWKNAGNITLGEGVWIVFVTLAFDANATGHRTLLVNKIEEDPTMLGYSYGDIRTPISAGIRTYLKAQFVVSNTEDSTLYVWAYQNSGGALPSHVRIQAVRIAEN